MTEVIYRVNVEVEVCGPDASWASVAEMVRLAAEQLELASGFTLRWADIDTAEGGDDDDA